VFEGMEIVWFYQVERITLIIQKEKWPRI
jgi:hypothetical protein